jgi:hypothetical protein
LTEHAGQKTGGRQTRKPTRRSAWWRIPTALVLVALCAVGFFFFVRDQLNNASLNSYGKQISAQIVATDQDNTGQGTYDYVWVLIPACQCLVQLDTDKPALHPRGSYIPVLYDTTNPTNARLLVDGGDSTWSIWLQDVIFIVLSLFGLFLALVIVGPGLSRLWRWMRRDGSASLENPF